MADISKELNQIKNAVYGREVRGSIHDGIDKINKESEGSRRIANNTEQRQNSVEQQFDTLLGEWSDDKPIDNAETIAARTNTKESKTYENLGKRLDEEYGKVTEQLAQTEQGINDLQENKASKQELYNESNAKADRSYVDNKVSDVNERIDNIIATPTTVSEQEIIDARESKTSLGANVRNIREKAETKLKNAVINGDFKKAELSEGMTINRGPHEFTSKGIKLLDGSGRSGTVINYILSDEVPTNQIWYLKARVRSLSDGANWLSLAFSGTSGVDSTTRINNPVKNEWYTLSKQADSFSGLSGTFSASVYSYWPDSSGKSIEVDYFMAINLTQAFGRGKEPSREVMDKLVDEFGYFEGDLGAGNLSRYLIEENEELLTEIKDTKKLSESNLENFITNGDFKENRDGWTSGDGTSSSHVTGWLEITGVGTNATPRVVQTVNTEYKKGDVLYLTADFKTLNTDVDSFGFAIYSDDSSESDIVYLLTDKYTANTIKQVYGNVKVASDAGNMRVQIRTRYSTAEISNGKTVSVTNVKAYNLTNFFGKGNEPSADAFKKMLSQMPSHMECKKPYIAETQKALTELIFDSMGSRPSNERPIFVVQFDDGFDSDYEKAFPFLQARGIKGTSYVTTGRTGTDRFMTWEQLHELKSSGWCIEGHSDDHSPLSTLPDASIREQMETVNAKMLANGFPKPRHHALPHGDGWQSERVLNIVSEYRKTIRNVHSYVSNDFNRYNSIDFKRLYGLGLEFNDKRMDRLQGTKDLIIRGAQENGIILGYSHRLVDENPSASASEGYFDIWAELIELARDLDYEFLTIEELYIRLK